MSELEHFEESLVALPATFLKLLSCEPPSFIPPPIDKIIAKFPEVHRIILVMIDNLGLFEITFYKPQFIIGNSNAMILLDTKNPYTLGVLHQLMFGGYEVEPNGFHLLRELNKQGQNTVFIGRARDIARYDGGTTSIKKDTDMATWVEAAKVINRYKFSLIHFLDFETLYRSKRQTPEELIQKLITRTDKWVLSMYKQARKNSLFVIIGNHGRSKIDLNLQGKVAEWRQASVPVAVLIYKNGG
ncbi:MAG: hypothetical protein ACTSRZ_16865 [Promethearchaeota archaeon]